MADVLPVGGKEPDRLVPGTRLGRYELLVPVARGGMARVWAARQHGQRGFTKIVAVKTILPHLRKEPQFERMFQNEARVASFVQHPNVCQILELGEDAEILFMAMEWINGDSLARALKASGRVMPMDPRIIARILADACAGLHAAHVQTDELGRPLNIVHRDVSPHNIMFTADGNVKVCDFGVAKALNQLQDATLAGQVKGKVSYMPPEQFMGSPLDARADIFAMGVVLYEATTGRQPFEGENDLIIMQRLARGDYAHPSLIMQGYPRELEQIVVRAMQPEPTHRFQNAEQMRIALEEWLAHSGPIVTQTNVAQAARERVGGLMEARRHQILQASQGQDPNQPIQDMVAMGGLAGHTPSNLQGNAQQNSGSPKSGVMPRGMPPLPASALPPPAPPALNPMKATMPLPPGMMPPLPPMANPVTIPPISSQSPPAQSPPAQFPQFPQASPSPQSPWWEQAREGASRVATVPPGAAFSPPQQQQLPQPAHFSMPPSSGGATGVGSGFDPNRGMQAAPTASPAPQAPQSSGASYYAIAIGLGVFFALIIGVAGYFGWSRSQHRSSEPVAIVSYGNGSPSASGAKSLPGVAVSSLPIAPPPSAALPSSSASGAPADLEVADDVKPAVAPTAPATATNAGGPSGATPPPVPTWTAPVATAATAATATTAATPATAPTATAAPRATANDAAPQSTSNNKSTEKPAATASPTPATTATTTKPVKPSALPDNPY